MNNGTKIRTILVVATCLNTALMATDVTQFGNETVNLIYRILSVAANFVIVFCATYYNNDYTEEGRTGTLVTREMKELRDAQIETVTEPADSHIEKEGEING